MFRFLVFVFATCEGGDNGCEDMENECCDKPDASEPGIGAVLYALLDTVSYLCLGISLIDVRVDVEYAEGT